jgi:serine phosphatase RsbU (regulator of sigma subunit)
VRRTAGQVVPLLNATGKSQPALGLMEKAEYHSSEVILSARDLILLFTDGLIEVQNPRNELYTQQLLLAAVQQRLQLPSPQLFDELLEEVRRFAENGSFTDDVCLVGIDLTSPE